MAVWPCICTQLVKTSSITEYSTKTERQMGDLTYVEKSLPRRFDTRIYSD
jgi:hypothetical protein